MLCSYFLKSGAVAGAAIATTGVAGPAAQDGKAAGTVFVACVEVGADGSVVASEVEELHLQPEVEDVRQARAGLQAREHEIIGAP